MIKANQEQNEDLLKIEKEKQTQKEVSESIDYIEEVDKSSGPEYVADFEKDKAAKEKDLDDIAKNIVDRSRGITTYKRKLAQLADQRIPDLDLPKDWEAKFVPTKPGHLTIFGKTFRTKDGVILILRSPKGKVFIRAIRVTENPNYDLNAVKTLLIQAENTVDSHQGKLLSDQKETKPNIEGYDFKQSDSGLYIPS